MPGFGVWWSQPAVGLVNADKESGKLEEVSFDIVFTVYPAMMPFDSDDGEGGSRCTLRGDLVSIVPTGFFVYIRMKIH